EPTVGTLDSSRWSAALVTGWRDTSIPLAQYGHQIHVGPMVTPARGSRYNGVVSQRSFDLTGAKAEIRIRTPPPADSSVQAVLTVAADPSNYYRAYVQNGDVVFEQDVSAVKTRSAAVAFPFSETSM